MISRRSFVTGAGGGGGDFGIVTAYEIAPTRIGELSSATSVWGYDAAFDVLDAWAHRIGQAPRALGGSAVVALPTRPRAPSPLSRSCGDHTVPQCLRAGSGPEAKLPRAAFARERGRLFDRPPARGMWEEAVGCFDAVRVPGQRRLLRVGALGGAVAETYQNFIDPRLRNWRGAYYAENDHRLVAVERAYDPHRLFRFGQSIG